MDKKTDFTLLDHIQGFNIVSPYGAVSGYDSGYNSGFYTWARSSDYLAGWGEPRKNGDGSPIIPGTAGGDYPIQFLTTVSAEENGQPVNRWYPHFRPGTYLYGEIDWSGQWRRKLGVTPIVEEGRERLTFHGPLSRVFANDAFVYGAEEKHNNIYYNGKVCSVAPFPVMGAGLQYETNPETQEITKWLIVACYTSPTVTTFYAREFTASGVLADAFTDGWRSAQMLVGAGGWANLGTHEPSGCSQGDSCVLRGQRTPWLFNESGTKAAQMREADITFDMAVSGVSAMNTTQVGYNLYRADITLGAINVIDFGNTDNPFTITVENSRVNRANYIATTKWPNSGSPTKLHAWTAKSYDQYLYVQGTYDVAVDWVGDDMRVLTVDCDIYRHHECWWYKGIDHDMYGYDDSTNNQDDLNGDMVGRENTSAAPGDGRTRRWIGIGDDIKLKWLDENGVEAYSPLVRRANGDYLSYQGLPTDPDQNFYYFGWEILGYPMAWNIKMHSGVLYSKETLRIVTPSFQLQSVYDNEAMHHWRGGETAHRFMENAPPKYTLAGEMGYGLEPPETWADSFLNTQVFRTFDLSWVQAAMPYPILSSGDIVSPDPISFYNGGNPNGAVPWGQWLTIKEMISGPRCSSYHNGMGVGATDDGKHAISIGYLHRHQTPSGPVMVPRYYNYLHNPDADMKGMILPTQPAGVVDGAGVESPQYWFFPLGVN